jgi:thiol:disulfide interchange protein/DsbC/DsbD-like thiol-disulfide interchange protein
MSGSFVHLIPMRLAFVLITATLWCLAQPVFGAATQAELLLDLETARPGDTVTAGVRLKMEPKWHTYWVNPGEAGDSTKIDWVLPQGMTAGWIQWPTPEKLNTEGIITYVYHGEAVLLVPLSIGSNQPPGKVELKANVSWFECEEGGLCVIGKQSLSAELTIGTERKPSRHTDALAKARAKLPIHNGALDMKAFWEKELPGPERFLILDWRPLAGSKGVPDFYPYPADGYEIGAATEQVSAPQEGRIRLRKPVKKLDEGNWPRSRYAAGVLVHGGTAYDVGPLIAALDEGPPFLLQLLAKLGAAFAGGLLLNIMPCVLPVLALKILSFVQQSKEAPGRVRLMGTVYGVGVLVSFAILAAIAVVVQQAGGLASWGMLLQNQVARILLTVVITLVALNLFGLFEINPGGRVLGAAGDLASREGLSGAFFNGVLATILATPCTAPFMAAALSYAFTQSPLTIVLIFLAAGLGLAAPFVVLSWNPTWLKLLPKPGPWMERFKIAMGFPMLATAVWLFWFTSSRMGSGAVLWLGLFLVLLAAAAWVWGEFVQRASRGRGVGMAVALALVAIGYFVILEHELHWRTRAARQVADGALKTSADGIDWMPWSPEAVASARAAMRPVLVDFTADNCLNCKLNKRTSLEIPEVRAKLKEIGAVALLADFSDGDPQIAAELRRYNRAGVPLVLVYPRDPKAPPMVLPIILTPSSVLGALDRAAIEPKATDLSSTQ